MSLTDQQILAIKNKLNLKNSTIQSYRNKYTIFKNQQKIFQIMLQSFPNTCGTFIASELYFFASTEKDKELAFKIIYEITKIKRKSAIIYLAAQWQTNIKDSLIKQKWQKLTGSFINHNSHNKNILYIKHVYKS